MVSFLRFLINGISLGSVYAIIALGYTMVYGIAKMLNFAHGDVIMVGAYIAFCAMSYLGLPPFVAVLCAMVVCTVLGVAHVLYDGRECASARLVASGSVDLNRWEYFKQHIRESLAKPAVLTVILVILVLVAAYLALVTRYRLLRRKHLKQRRLAEQRRKELARQRAEEAARAENGTPFDKDLF